MRHTFQRAVLDQLLTHTRAAPEHATLYEQPDTARPGLWLCGDEGVYLMSNGRPMLPNPAKRLPGKDGAIPHLVCYADEVNPDTLQFDRWWNAKRRGFGGDDGCDFFALDFFERALSLLKPGEPLLLEISAKEVSALVPKPIKAA